jgi:hypothetical protein
MLDRRESARDKVIFGDAAETGGHGTTQGLRDAQHP